MVSKEVAGMANMGMGMGMGMGMEKTIMTRIVKK
jgi:hypothetical protein